MKTPLSLIFTLLLSYFSLMAQDSIRVVQQATAFASGEQPAYSVDIPQAKVKNVKDLWIKTNKKGSKVAEANDEVSINGAIVERISASPVNFLSKIVETQNGSRLLAVIRIDSALLTEENVEKDQAAKNYLADFAKEAYREAVREELKEQEKILKDKEDVLKKLINENEKMHKSISMNKGEIAELNQDLDRNRVVRTNMVKVAVSDSTRRDIDAASAPVDTKDIDKDAKKIRKKIVNLESDNRNIERQIPENLTRQEAAQRDIDAQRKVVEQVQAKLDAIK